MYPRKCLLKDSKIPGLHSFHSAAVITHSDVKQLRVKASLWQNPPLRVFRAGTQVRSIEPKLQRSATFWFL